MLHTEQKGPNQQRQIIFPIGNSWATNNRQRREKSEKESEKEPEKEPEKESDQYETDGDNTPKIFSENSEINKRVCSLQDRMLMGEKGLQVEIDKLITVELITRDTRMFARMESLTNGRTIETFTSSLVQTIQTENLPDLGHFIRQTIYCSGNNQETQFFDNTLLNYLIYESIPNIKRTKH